MASKVDIANAALAWLGDTRIASLTEDTAAARAVNGRYDEVRDACLAAAPWNFARRRASLAALSTAPAFEYSYQFTLPTDPWCLRVLSVDGLYGDQWEVEGRTLLCDEATVKLRYVARIDNPETYSPHFVEYMAAKLAAALAYRVTGQMGMTDRLLQAAELALRDATRIDAAEGRSPRVRADTLTRQRTNFA